MFLFLTGGLAIVYALFVRTEKARVASYAGLAFVAAAGAAFSLAIWLPRATYLSYEWWGTAWTIIGLSVPAFACLVGFAPGDRRHWRWIGAAATAASLAVTMIIIWAKVELSALIAAVLSIALLIAYANLVLLLKLRPGQIWLRWGALGFALVTAALINVLVDTDFSFAEETLARSIAASGIVTACGTLALIVLAAFNRRGDVEFESKEMYEVSLKCPRCGREHDVRIGGDRCPSCGLRIDIRIEEPRCAACDYLLYRLESDRCPECGTPVAEQERIV